MDNHTILYVAGAIASLLLIIYLVGKIRSHERNQYAQIQLLSAIAKELMRQQGRSRFEQAEVDSIVSSVR
jgi:hypothetical protein